MRVKSPYIRCQDWPEKLAEHLSEGLWKPFQWGAHDCATMACDGAQLLIGVDPMASIRGSYASEDEADAIISAAGGFEALAQQLAGQAGLPESPAGYAQRGDLVLVAVGNQQALGIMSDAGAVAPSTDGGTTTFPRRTIIRAWSV